MKMIQFRLNGPQLNEAQRQALDALAPQLILAFGDVSLLSQPEFYQGLHDAWPAVLLAGCSTAGEIGNDGVSNGECVLTGVRFEQARMRGAQSEVAGMADSQAAGQRLAEQLAADGLRHVLLFGPGVDLNGSALIEGLRSALPPNVTISGGLAGDGGAFKQTFTLSTQGCSPRGVVAIGFYGEQLAVHNGSFHGWAPFGPMRKVTRAEGNLLYELDGEPALEVYKRYLGEYARDLPASGLLFPFEMIGSEREEVGLIRTILGVDEAQGMLILAGDIDANGYLRLMHAHTDSLVDGAQVAAERAAANIQQPNDALAILVSCVGRKLVMGVRVDEEVEAVADIFGQYAQLAGFYSYGEISPVAEGLDCKLHNQTMTITLLSETD